MSEAQFYANQLRQRSQIGGYTPIGSLLLMGAAEHIDRLISALTEAKEVLEIVDAYGMFANGSLGELDVKGAIKQAEAALKERTNG